LLPSKRKEKILALRLGRKKDARWREKGGGGREGLPQEKNHILFILREEKGRERRGRREERGKEKMDLERGTGLLLVLRKEKKGGQGKKKEGGGAANEKKRGGGKDGEASPKALSSPRSFRKSDYGLTRKGGKRDRPARREEKAAS